MGNTKTILGIVAGVTALAVVGIILKRRGHLDSVINKAEDIGGGIADKYSTIKESARKKFDQIVEKGGDIADKIATQAEKADTAKATPTIRI